MGLEVVIPIITIRVQGEDTTKRPGNNSFFFLLFFFPHATRFPSNSVT